jgi:hypothetical protein
MPPAVTCVNVRAAIAKGLLVLWLLTLGLGVGWMAGGSLLTRIWTTVVD